MSWTTFMFWGHPRPKAFPGWVPEVSFNLCKLRRFLLEIITSEISCMISFMLQKAFSRSQILTIFESFCRCCLSTGMKGFWIFKIAERNIIHIWAWLLELADQIFCPIFAINEAANQIVTSSQSFSSLLNEQGCHPQAAITRPWFIHISSHGSSSAWQFILTWHYSFLATAKLDFCLLILSSKIYILLLYLDHNVIYKAVLTLSYSSEGSLCL